MATLKPMGAGRTIQADATILLDDGFYNFFRVNPLDRPAFIKPVEKGFRRAAVTGVNSIKNRITSMKAVATGFMRKTVGASVRVNPNRNPRIQLTFGTSAWYDILVHEGLGRHSRSGGEIPPQYLPSELQKAIIEPNDFKTRLKYFKRSPKIPRPFLTEGIKAAQTSMNADINNGIKAGLAAIGSKRGVPKHKFQEVLQSGGII